jgi:hypothetical protein
LKSDVKAKLSINKKEIDMNAFVEGLVAHVTIGAVNSLDGVDNVKTVDLNMDKGEIDIMVNKENIRVTPFPNDIIAATLLGLVSLLKGVEDVEQMKIEVDAGQ